MTCCSTESSYLERRGSAYTLGLGSVPPSLRRKLSSASRTSSTENWDYFYPGIQIIRATPNTSPCSSEKRGRHGSPVPSRHARLRKQSTIGKGFSNSSYDAEAGTSSYIPPPQPSTSTNNGAIPKIPKTTIAPSTSYQQFQVNEKQPTPTSTAAATAPSTSSSHRLSFRSKKPLGSLTSIADDLPEELTVSSVPSVPIKRAPLASLSSFKISSLDYQDSENRSVDYDSLFMDSIPDDTDHEIDGFSTDSDDVCGVDGSCRQFTTVIVNQADSSVAPVTTTITASTAADDNIKFSKKLDIGKCSSRLFGSSSFKLRSSRRPTLERHKTISSAYSSSTDQILIIGQEELLPLKTLNMKPTEVSTTFIQGTPTTSPITTLPPQPQQLLSSSRLGNLNDDNIPVVTATTTTTVIQMANLSPNLSLGAKRKPLKTQVSDTPSLPTNTDDTTPETCSITIHTEIMQEPAAASSGKTAVVVSVRKKSCSCSDLSRGFCSCKEEDGMVSEKGSYAKAIMIEMPVIRRQNTSDDVVEVTDDDEEVDEFEYADENPDQDPYSKETLF